MKIQRFFLLVAVTQARFFADEIEEITTGTPELVTWTGTEAETVTLDDATEALNVTEAATVPATEATSVTEETATIKLETTAEIIVPTFDPFENSTFVFPNVTLPDEDTSSGCSSGCIIGAVVGSVLGVMLIAFGLFTCLSTKKEVAPTDVDNSPESSGASSRTNSMSD